MKLDRKALSHLHRANTLKQGYLGLLNMFNDVFNPHWNPHSNLAFQLDVELITNLSVLDHIRVWQGLLVVDLACDFHQILLCLKVAILKELDPFEIVDHKLFVFA